MELLPDGNHVRPRSGDPGAHADEDGVGVSESQSGAPPKTSATDSATAATAQEAATDSFSDEVGDSRSPERGADIHAAEDGASASLNTRGASPRTSRTGAATASATTAATEQEEATDTDSFYDAVEESRSPERGADVQASKDAVGFSLSESGASPRTSAPSTSSNLDPGSSASASATTEQEAAKETDIFFDAVGDSRSPERGANVHTTEDGVGVSLNQSGASPRTRAPSPARHQQGHPAASATAATSQMAAVKERFPDGVYVVLQNREHGTYLHADEDRVGVCLSELGASVNTAWRVHRVVRDGGTYVLLYGAAYGRYITLSPQQTPRNSYHPIQLYDAQDQEAFVWELVPTAPRDKDVFLVRHVFSNCVLRANGLYGFQTCCAHICFQDYRRRKRQSRTMHWVVQVIQPPPDTPHAPLRPTQRAAMEHFPDGQRVRLRSRGRHGMYLHADEDGVGVHLSWVGASLHAAWQVHRVKRGGNTFVLLHAAADGRYLAATNDAAPPGHLGQRVVQGVYNHEEDAFFWIPVEVGTAEGDEVLLHHATSNRLLRAANRKYFWRRTGVSVDGYVQGDTMMHWVVEVEPILPRPETPVRIAPNSPEAPPSELELGKPSSQFLQPENLEAPPSDVTEVEKVQHESPVSEHELETNSDDHVTAEADKIQQETPPPDLDMETISEQNCSGTISAAGAALGEHPDIGIDEARDAMLNAELAEDNAKLDVITIQGKFQNLTLQMRNPRLTDEERKRLQKAMKSSKRELDYRKDLVSRLEQDSQDAKEAYHRAVVRSRNA